MVNCIFVAVRNKSGREFNFQWRIMYQVTQFFGRSIIAVILLVALASSSKPKLVKQKVGNDITVAIPGDWLPMDENDLIRRYPSVRAPLAAFTNEERLADFTVNISATQWPDTDANMAQKFFKSGIANLFDRVDFIAEGSKVVGKRKFIWYEFDSIVNGSGENTSLRDPVRKYSYILYSLEPGRTLVFSFNCPQRQKAQWQSVAKAMMAEIRIK